MALNKEITPVFGNALYKEYEDVLARSDILELLPLKHEQVEVIFNALLSASRWVPIYYLWRPNLRDEGDNHLLELAVAAGASAIITANVRDFKDSALLFPEIRILTAGAYLEERSVS